MSNTHTFTINELVQLIPVACTKRQIVFLISGVIERVMCRTTYGSVAPDFIFHLAIVSSQSELPIQSYGQYTTSCTTQDVFLYGRILCALGVFFLSSYSMFIPIFSTNLNKFSLSLVVVYNFCDQQFCQMGRLHIVISINTKIERINQINCILVFHATWSLHSCLDIRSYDES